MKTLCFSHLYCTLISPYFFFLRLFHTAMATEKMDIMESSDGIHTAVVTAMEKIEFFLSFLLPLPP